MPSMTLSTPGVRKIARMPMLLSMFLPLPLQASRPAWPAVEPVLASAFSRHRPGRPGLAWPFRLYVLPILPSGRMKSCGR